MDPSSTRTRGSILGDKTRMAALAVDENAFIRPSPSAGTLGGVARATRETIVLMEAAGYDVVLVETVGVGQSEVAVAGMVDTFLLLTIARTGDSLQGIKKGILELADVVAVNKADGGARAGRPRGGPGAGRGAAHDEPRPAGWRPPVLACSGRTGDGLAEVWAAVQKHRAALDEAGELARKRAGQQVDWMWAMVRDQLMDRLRTDPAVRARLPELEREVRGGALTPTLAARAVLDLLAADPSLAGSLNATARPQPCGATSRPRAGPGPALLRIRYARYHPKVERRPAVSSVLRVSVDGGEPDVRLLIIVFVRDASHQHGRRRRRRGPALRLRAGRRPLAAPGRRHRRTGHAADEYVDPAGRFAIVPPAGWQAMDDPTRASLVQFAEVTSENRRNPPIWRST